MTPPAKEKWTPLPTTLPASDHIRRGLRGTTRRFRTSTNGFPDVPFLLRRGARVFPGSRGTLNQHVNNAVSVQTVLGHVEPPWQSSS